jgi:hypothetical protein
MFPDDDEDNDPIEQERGHKWSPQTDLEKRNIKEQQRKDREERERKDRRNRE